MRYVVLLLVLGLASCGRGYSDQNEEAARPFVESDMVEVGAVTTERYCRQDTCWFGDDGTFTVYDVTLAGAAEDVVIELTSVLPDWQVTLVSCTGEDSDCENDNVIFAIRDGEVLRLAFDNNGIGELTVDTEPVDPG